MPISADEAHFKHTPLDFFCLNNVCANREEKNSVRAELLQSELEHVKIFLSAQAQV